MDLRTKLKSTGLLQVIGNTPVMKVQSLSALSGCEIFMKCENLNPGGTIKDRPAMNMVIEAIVKGILKPGMTIVEGTAGNTGIGLALVGQALGHKVIVVMPKGMAQEKHKVLKLYGAEIVETDAVPYSDEKHFFKVGKKIGQSNPEYWWANQFDNPDNYLSHYHSTAPEMYQQMDGKINAVIVAAGSGGTAAGVSKYMKEKNHHIKIIMPDPMGSGIVNYFNKGNFDSDGSYTMTEGVGITRMVENFRHIKQDSCFTIDDQKLTYLAMYLREKEGLVMGMSSMLNLAGAFSTALKSGAGQRIITFMCDGGERAISKMYSPEFLKEKSLNGSLLQENEIKEIFQKL
ncbi:MAG TPA: cysteine synthase A [Bacteriovoracaceae bacterium]|nr:cysteine synthase A [Bacteriovoracaceae bacterium]